MKACCALLSLLLAAACNRTPDLETVQQFEQANHRLAEAKSPDESLAAAALFEQVLARGGENGAVLHGLGNAWFQAGKKGAAIAAWQRALAYRPRDPYLRANLGQAAAGLPTRTLGWIDELLFWQDDLSYGEKGWLLTTLVAIACLAFALARRVERSRPWSRPLLVVSGVLSLVAALSFALDVHAHEFTLHGVIAAPDVVARKGDAESFEPAFTEPLPEGIAVRVLDRRGEWLRVRIDSGLEGWVPAARVVTW